jgi:hypothetical protein
VDLIIPDMNSKTFYPRVYRRAAGSTFCIVVVVVVVVMGLLSVNGATCSF